ncbi:MKRN2 opposite strand, tandem duplicate 1 isoform X2 [Festucalex cinctus]
MSRVFRSGHYSLVTFSHKIQCVFVHFLHFRTSRGSEVRTWAAGMMELSDLLRFSHCGRTVFTAPSPAGLRCPECDQAPRFSLAEAPVRVRAPVVNGHRTSCCFLVTSRHGADGLSEEANCELHVGISNSEGVVLSYTESGVRRQQHGWEQSVAVPLVAPGDCIPNWDTQLDRFAAMDTWTPDRFEEQREFGSCCYGFALGFINQLMMSQGKQPITRQRFTTDLVLPRLEAASSGDAKRTSVGS